MLNGLLYFHARSVVWTKQGRGHTGTMTTVLDGDRQALFLIIGVGAVVDRLGVGVVTEQRTGLWVALGGIDTADGLECRAGVGAGHDWLGIIWMQR